MTRPSKVLDNISLAEVETYLNPPQPVLTLESPALMFMTDFLQVHPVVVHERCDVTQALNLMKNAYVRLLVVTNDDESRFLGAVTAADLNGAKVFAAMVAHEFKRRDEVEVKHVMIDRAHIHGLKYSQVDNHTIGDVLETIKHLSEQHIMVVESHGQAWVIRGMFSTTNIAKALHIKFDVEPQAKTFFELEQVILHHRL